MTRQDLETMFNAVDRRDWDTVAKYFHPELVYDRPGFDQLVGGAAVDNFYRNIRTIHGVHQFEGFAIDGETGACWGRFVGTRKDGSSLDVEFADCYRFKAGQLWRRKSFFYVPAA